MNVEVFRPHMDELNKAMDDVEKMLARNVGIFTKITEEFVTDIRINLRDMILPGHKYVLSSRCKVLAKTISTGVDELDWTSYESNIGIGLLRWFYTDKVASDDDSVQLGLLRAAHDFGLPTLFEACESRLLTSINKDCSRAFYEIAKEVNAKRIMEKCLEWKATLDDGPSAQQQLEDVIEDNLKALSLGDVDLTSLSSPSLQPIRDELMELIKRKRNVDEGCIKLGKSLIGVKRYMEFFDTTIWTWLAHKYFLISRSEKLGQVSNSWSGLTKSNEFVLMRWLYTDHIHIDSIDIALALLDVAHKFNLQTLFVICEEAVIEKISVKTCAHVHRIASKVSSTKALEECERITTKYWDCIKSVLNEVAADSNKSKDAEGTICEFPPRHAEIEAGTLLTLNYDCLLHLTRFIPMVDLGSVRDTCRQLSEVADRSFQLYGHKSLVIRRGSMVADLWNLKHFGKYIHSLALESLYQPYCSFADVFSMIGLFSTERLKSFSLCLDYDPDVTVESLQCLASIVKNVEKIEIESVNGQGIVESVLHYCENLSEVHIDCEGLELEMSWSSKNKHIKSVTLRYLDNDDHLEEMCENLVHLESFSFSIAVITDKLNHLCRLDHLKQLKIEHFDPTLTAAISSLLENLAKKNVLEHLSIMFDGVVEATAHAICNFSKLRELVFDCVESFDNSAINILSEKLNNVEKLMFLYCDEITMESITKIIMNNLDLKELTITGCESVDVIDRKNYLRLRKRRNLQIFLDKDIFEKTIKLLANDLSDYVKIAVKRKD